MKFILLSILTFISLEISAQRIYKSYDYPDFQDLIKNGIVFYESKNNTDSLYIKAFQKYWNVCPYKIISYKSKEKIDGEQILLTNGGRELIFAKAKELTLNEINKYSTIGYVISSGFGISSNSKSAIDLNISFINATIKHIKDNKISSRGSKINEEIQKAQSIKNKYKKSKSLLILESNLNYISVKKLTKLGIKYKVINQKEYESLTDKDLSNSYILYVDSFDFLTFSIFDLETRQIVVTCKEKNTAKRNISFKPIKKWTK